MSWRGVEGNSSSMTTQPQLSSSRSIAILGTTIEEEVRGEGDLEALKGA
jgi:hypothetical protein